MKYFGMVLLAWVLLPVPVAWTGDAAQGGPSPQDRCPVCGMFVAKYPDFLATVRFRDGARFFFDGPKDMFKYYLDIAKYHPGRKQADIKAITVTDYYSLSPIDAFGASYVVGSNVYGPMGRELIPFAREDDAKAFMQDHQGKSLIKFREVTLPLAKGLN